MIDEFNLYKIVQSARIKLSDEERISIDTKNCINSFNHFVKTRQMPVAYLSSRYYDLLWKFYKIINYKNDLKLKLANKVEVNYINDLNNFYATGRIKQSNYEYVICDIDNNISLLFLKKQEILKHFFTELKQKGENIETLINQALNK